MVAPPDEVPEPVLVRPQRGFGEAVFFVCEVQLGGNSPTGRVARTLLLLSRAKEGVIELFSHRDDRASWIVSAFVVGDCDDEAKTQSEEDLRSCVDAASGGRTPEAAVLD